MPRRKSVDSSAPVQKRARTGCLTCRSRKVKCDEAKPRCRNCSRRGLTCDTGIQLKWEQEFSSRGLAFGRQGRWSKDRGPGSPGTPASTPQLFTADFRDPVQWCLVPLVQPHHFINTFYYDFDLDSCGSYPAEEGPSDAVTPCSEPSSGFDDRPLLLLDDLSLSPAATTLAISRSPSPFPSLVSIDSSLLEYYLLRLCPLTTPSRLASSPFAQLIVPLFGLSGQEDVQQAVMALSARHRSTTDKAWAKTAMTLKGSVITSLRRRILAVGNGSDVIWDPQILIIMMFLCLYEIVDNCDHRWVIHLRASEDIIRRSRQIMHSHVYKDFGELTTFTERFFAFQDAISRTACGNSPLFGIEYWDNNSSQPTDIDTWMGCSPALVKVLCRITELSQLKARGDISAPGFERQSADLELELYQMRQPDGAAGDTLAAAAELKRKSVLLYHHCVLYGASPSTPFVCELVRDILEGLQDLVRAGVTAGLAFPVFVAAVELDPIDDQLFQDKHTGELVHGRRLVLEMLDEIGRCSLSNISRTKAVIQKVWRTRDMSFDEDATQHRRRSSETNDWSLFVGPYSSNISLA